MPGRQGASRGAPRRGQVNVTTPFGEEKLRRRLSRDSLLLFVMPPRTSVRGQGIFNIFLNKENVLFFKKFEDRLTKRLALLER